MRFVSTELFDHILLYESSNIKSMVLDFRNPVQMIVAANGAGKSTLMNAITTLSLDKSLYKQSGMVKHTIEHAGRIYEILITPNGKIPYQISSLTDPDTSNINKSGNVGSYEEHIEAIFGYNKHIDKLMRLQYQITDMSRAARKDFISLFNPYNVQLTEEYYKNVASTNRSFKSQLKMLHGRKAIITSKLLDPRQMEELRYMHGLRSNRLVELKEQALLCNAHMEALLDVLRKMRQDSPDIDNTTIGDLTHRVGKIRDKIHRVFTGSDERIYTDTNTLDFMIDTMQKRLVTILEDLNSNKKVYEKYAGYINIDVQAELSTRQAKLEQLTAALDQLPESPFGMDAYYVQKTIEQLAGLQSTIEEYLHCLPLQKVCVIDRIKSRYQYLGSKTRKMQDRLISIEAAIEADEAVLQSRLKDRMPMDCKRSDCNLRETYTDALTITRLRCAKNNDDAKHLRAQLDRYSRVLEKQQFIISTEPCALAYDQKVRVLPKNVLERLFKDTDPFDGLNRNASDLTVRISNTSSLLNDQLVRWNIEREIAAVNTEISKIVDSDIPVQELVSTIAGDAKARMDSLDDEHTKIYSEWTKIEKARKDKTEYERLMLELENLAYKAESFYDYSMHAEHYKLYRHILGYFNEQINILQTQLTSDVETIKLQDKMLTVLDDEINPVIADLETKVREYTLVERELGPNGCSHRYTVLFINRIIDIANIVLKNTWNYDLRMVPLNQDDDLTFDIKRIVKGKEAKDISRCSQSQKDIINIAFSLGIILHEELGYGKTYPLYMDECDEHMDASHRERLIALINDLIRTGNIRQLFNINHHIALSAGVVNADIVCLSDEYIVIPDSANQHVKIEYA